MAGYRSPPNPYAFSPPIPPSAPSYGQAHPRPSQPPSRKGTLSPGQLVKVGDHVVRIERYLSEGGYAHVYLTSSETPIYPPNSSKGLVQHCLKRIAFQDEAVWADVRKEIEVMVRLLKPL